MASAYFGVIRRELAARKFSQAFIDNLELILTGLNSTTTTADAATASLAVLQAIVTALQAEVDAIEPDAALLVPPAFSELPGGAVGQVQYNSNGVFGGFTVSGDGTLDTSTGVFTLATVPILKGGTGATTAAGARTNLGLAIGTDVQAFDSDLSAVAGLSTTGLMARTGTGTAATRTLTAPAAGITVSNGDGVSGNPTLALANDLSALEALSGTNTIYYRSGVDTWSVVTFSNLTFSGGVLTAMSASSGGTITTTAIATPQGRLSLVTGVPVMTSDQTAKTHVYYTNYVGPNLPIYDGTNWAVFSLSSDLDMALDTTNQLVENVYDLYGWSNSGTPAIGAGPAWSNAATITVTIATPGVVTWTAHGLYEGAPVIFTNSGGALPTGITAGTTYYVGRSPATNTFNISTTVANAAAGTFVATSGSQSGTHTGTNHTTLRGTGAGTTELQMLNGVWTNKNSITLTNGAGAGTSVSANRATYLGSAYMTANGQTGVSLSPAAAAGGSNNFVALFNAYNPKRTFAIVRDSTASWTYGSTTVRAADNSVANRTTYLDGLAQISVAARVSIFVANGSGTAGIAGINRNSTNATPAAIAQGSANVNHTLPITNSWAPALGVSYIQQVEAASANVNNTWFGSTAGWQYNIMIVELEY